MSKQSYLKGIITGAACAVFSLSSLGQFYDGSNVQFGKNRVQHRTFEWQYLPTDHAEVYYYQGGKSYAGQITAHLSDWIEDVESLYDRKLDGAVQVLVFNKQTEFRQSNIGSNNDPTNNIGGIATLVGSKIFIYPDGEWAHTEQRVKESLSNLLLNQMLHGGDWQDALRSSTTGLTLPEWFTAGLHSYVAQPWSAETALHVQDAARCRNILEAHRAEASQAAWVGHGVWKYIADIFGEAVIANALYMVRVSNSLEKGLQYATGMNLSLMLEEASMYHLELAGSPADLPPLATRKDIRLSRTNTGDVSIKLSKDGEVRSFTAHPDGQHIAWAQDERGQLQIWYGNRTTGEYQRVGKHGHKVDRIQDQTLPAMAWHPNGNILTYAIEEGSRNLIYSVDLTTFESVEKEVFRIDKIRSMAYAPDGMTMIWSGVKDGQSDLYQYQVIGNNHTALWTDPYDDLDPIFSDDGQCIWFTSNRPNAQLNRPFVLGEPLRSYHDVFQLLWTEDIPQLIHWIDTPERDERFPQVQPEEHVAFLVETSSGQQERWISWRDSAVAYIDTAIHYRFYTEERLAERLELPTTAVQWIPENQTNGYVHQLNDHVFWVERPENSSNWETPESNEYSTLESPTVTLNWDWTPGPTEADFRNYKFGPWTPISADADADEPSELPVSVQGSENMSWTPFNLPKPRNYRLNYAMESVTGQLDNSFGSNFYQSYTGNIAIQPGLGGLSRISMADLFEDRRFTAGFRITGSLENSHYLLSYSDLSSRWDRTWIIERQGFIQGADNGQTYVKNHIHLLRRQWKYALDEVRSLRIQGTCRLDRITPLSTDAFNLVKTTQFANQLGVQVAYVFDNTRERMMNIPEGTRYRAWIEYFANPTNRSETFGTIGFDFRTYHTLWRDIIWANRIAADWSIGEQRLLHLLGGVDNTLSLASNAQTPVDPDINYAYQTRLAPLRGFNTNARNGSHMALINSEIRMPIWSSLSRQPSESELLQTLQAVGFLDIGSAWNGKHPYDNANTFNQVTVNQNPITVTIDNNREPIIWGTGFGLRAKVFGYWVRTDWSWGVDDGRWQDRVFNLSLQLDF